MSENDSRYEAILDSTTRRGTHRHLFPRTDQPLTCAIMDQFLMSVIMELLLICVIMREKHILINQAGTNRNGKDCSTSGIARTNQGGIKVGFNGRSGKGERTTENDRGRRLHHLNFMRTPSTGQRARTLMESW